MLQEIFLNAQTGPEHSPKVVLFFVDVELWLENGLVQIVIRSLAQPD